MNNRDDIAPKFMDLFNSRYYRHSKKMLCILGVWPYQSVLERKIRIFFPLFLSYSALVPQIREMILSWGRFDRFAKCFPPLATNLGCQIKLVNFMFKKSLLKKILDETLEDWKQIQHRPEVNILIKSAEKGRMWTVVWTFGVYFSLTIWLLLVMIPKILDIIDPLNETRKVYDLVPADYGVDPKKYYYPIQIHCWSGAIVMLLVMPAVDTLYMCLAQHACAQFEILRCTMNNIIGDDEAVSVMLDPSVEEDIHYHQVIICIKKHKALLKYINDLAASNASSLLIIVGVNMIGLSITGYEAVGKDTDSEAALRYGIYCLCLAIHLFVITLPGHWIMTTSSAFQNYAYGTKWYMMSLRTRKLILLVIRASIQPSTITAGKIYVMSLQNFSAVLRASMSYLTMFISISS